MFNYCCREKREHDLVMAGYGISSSALLGGTPDHVCVRTVVLNKIHVYGGEVPEGGAEVSAKRDRFQKYFRKKHSGAEIDVNSALKSGYQGAEGQKISMRRRAR